MSPPPTSAGRRLPKQASLFELELDDEVEAVEEATGAALPAPAVDLELRPRGPAPAVAPAPFRARLFAGLVDVGVHGAVAVVAVLGGRILGVQPTLEQLPALLLLLLVFSLFYAVVPLAFWGKTPGLAAVGLRCHAGDDLPLTFAEALRRWLGGVVTVLALGLPGLLAIGAGGRSLSDRWSGSELVAEG